MTSTLEAQNLTRVYRVGDNQIPAVQAVDLHLNQGEFVALVGPSGSGKTTLLAMLAGLLDPSQGSVRIKGQNLGDMSEAERTEFRRHNIGFTFQENNLMPYLTARENVELMLRLTQQPDRERAEALLERLGLSDRMDNLPSQLSGGQQQRVAIARALIHEPDLVLADEPTTSLDTERAYQVVDIFASLIREQNRAGIIVTHDLRMCQFVDRVIEMVDGRIERNTDDQDEIDERYTLPGQ